MKFGETWKDAVSTMEQPLKSACLDYKKYKKLSKRDVQSTHLEESLHTDLARATQVFQTYFTRCYDTQPFLWMWTCTRPLPVSPDELHLFATLNATALYKICKRFDKRQHISTYSDWYRQSIQNKSILFARKNIQAVLEFSKSIRPDVECPICFDPIQKDSVIILNCGHVLCASCVLGVLGVDRMHGTFANRIAHGAHANSCRARCPLCREPGVFQNWKQF